MPLAFRCREIFDIFRFSQSTPAAPNAEKMLISEHVLAQKSATIFIRFDNNEQILHASNEKGVKFKLWKGIRII